MIGSLSESLKRQQHTADRLCAIMPWPPAGGIGCGSFVECMQQLTALEELRCQTSESLIFYNKAICLDGHELAALSQLTALRALNLSSQVCS